jgi:hypothetical protein
MTIRRILAADPRTLLRDRPFFHTPGAVSVGRFIAALKPCPFDDLDDPPERILHD